MMNLVAKIPDHVDASRVFSFDIYRDAGVLSDLHSRYAELHAEAPPVFFTPENGGHWMVTRYDEISEVVMDPAHFSTAEMAIPRIAGTPVLIPLNLDPPRNVPYRQILMPIFSPRAIADM